MREEAPENFVEKESTYKKVAAMYIAKHNVPKSLVFGIDETNALFVNRATRQRAKKGAKRVRVTPTRTMTTIQKSSKARRTR
jgi:hypothetical protein